MGESSRQITKAMVERMQPGALLWDGKVKGFGVRRQTGEGRYYVVKARAKGRQRWITIGRHGSPWTVEGARDAAKSILGQIVDGADPANERDAERQAATLAEIAVVFMDEHTKAKRRPRTVETYQDLLDRLILPDLGKHRLKDLTRSDVARWHHDHRTTPVSANRALLVLSKLCNWAERHGLRPDGSNPCRHVERYPEQRRERFLSETELASLAKALAKVKGRKGVTTTRHIVAAIRLLLFTGARLGEILTLKWEHVDLEAGVLRLAESKTGAKLVYLNAPAREVLANLPRLKGNPYVIIGEKKGAHLVNLEKPWRRVRKAAGLDDVRLHDLRHSFASMGAAGGMSLPLIGKLLGHSQAQTTHRYAHLADDPVRQASEAVAARIAAAMAKPKGKARGNVVKLHATRT